MKLILFPHPYTVCKFAPDTTLPRVLQDEAWISITRTAEELSLVCAEQAFQAVQAEMPVPLSTEAGWRLLRIAGTLAFSEIGVLAALALPLKQVGVSIFVVSTFDTDYLLVKETSLELARAALQAAGHQIA